jgi:hypothetical protein
MAKPKREFPIPEITPEVVIPAVDLPVLIEEILAILPKDRAQIEIDLRYHAGSEGLWARIEQARAKLEELKGNVKAS